MGIWSIEFQRVVSITIGEGVMSHGMQAIGEVSTPPLPPCVRTTENDNLPPMIMDSCTITLAFQPSLVNCVDAVMLDCSVG